MRKRCIGYPYSRAWKIRKGHKVWRVLGKRACIRLSIVVLQAVVGSDHPQGAPFDVGTPDAFLILYCTVRRGAYISFTILADVACGEGRRSK